MTCVNCKHDTAKRFGTYGKRRVQRYRCNSCRHTFSDPKPQSQLGTMRIPLDQACRAINCLVEGCSIRSTERLTGLNRNTIMRLLIIAGERCERLLDTTMRGVSCKHLQVDELWCFVQKKARHVRDSDPDEFGDQWIYVAMDADTKMVIQHAVGDRTMPFAQQFMWNLYHRLSGRTQLTTDGLPHYTKAVPECFGTDADFAQVVKLFGDYGQRDSQARYSPGPIVEVISKVRSGNPDPKHVSTSYIERQNLTCRMQLRRLTRLTNAFSRKLSHLKAAVALHFAWYNFVRVHQSLRVTPAMEAGITDQIWTLPNLLSE